MPTPMRWSVVEKAKSVTPEFLTSAPAATAPAGQLVRVQGGTSVPVLGMFCHPKPRSLDASDSTVANRDGGRTRKDYWSGMARIERWCRSRPAAGPLMLDTWLRQRALCYCRTIVLSI